MDRPLSESDSLLGLHPSIVARSDVQISSLVANEDESTQIDKLSPETAGNPVVKDHLSCSNPICDSTTIPQFHHYPSVAGEAPPPQPGYPKDNPQNLCPKMRQVSTAPVLAELNNPSTLEAQAQALRALKNEVIGHQQRKDLWIRHGVVGPLARILNKQRSSTPRWQDAPTQPMTRVGSEPRSTDEDVLVQAIIIIGSLAQGGPRFVLPLAASQIITPLASLLNPAASSPSTVLAALRTLNTIADSSALEQRPGNEKGDWVLKPLYADQHLGYLSDIISQDSPALITQQQISLAAALVSKTCHEESCRKQLAYSGVLEALALRVASFVILLAEQQHQDQRRSSNLPKFAIQSAPSRARLAPILQAIAIIITNSSNRVTQFLHAPAFASVFQYSELEGWKISPAKNQSMNNGSFVDVGSLPPLHRSSPSSSTSFPPLGEMARWGKPKPAKDEGSPRTMAGTPEDEETPIAGWLVHVIQAEQGVTRVMAAWLLAILFREGHAGKSRERLLSMQLVPLLVRMLEADNTFSEEVSPSYDDSVIQPPRWLIKRLAPQVLGLLVSENELLQRAASEAGVIKKLSQMLKQTFDPLPQNESLALWNPDPSAETPMPDASSTFSKLGPAGLTPSGYQVLQTRAAVIGAIAAMATRSDDYRKAIMNSGVVAHLISSLKPVPSAPAGVASHDKSKVDPADNPTLVLMQACAAATALSRSVSTLRTSLIEAGLAKPIFELLEHPDMQVQIAATGAVCNIVLEFSPMRQQDVDASVLETLCRHAHSANSQLRLNSLWALKHLVHSAGNEFKIKCINSLGSSWLKQVISNDTDTPSSSAHLSMGTSNAAGEQVDLLNAPETNEPPEDDEVSMVDSIGNLSRLQGAASRESAGRRSALAQDEEADRAARARRDDVLVQEQALDLMRNLMAGTGSADMIDYIFTELGQESLFNIFASLLRSRPTGPRTSSPSNVTPTRPAPPHPEIVLSVVFILVHLATGFPRHRQQLLAQTELMRLFIPLAAHPSASVRMAYAWFVINLTWVEDSNNRPDARARALDLRKLGLEERLEALQRDSDLDVRERAKQAAASLQDLLKAGI